MFFHRMGLLRPGTSLKAYHTKFWMVVRATSPCSLGDFLVVSPGLRLSQWSSSCCCRAPEFSSRHPRQVASAYSRSHWAEASPSSGREHVGEQECLPMRLGLRSPLQQCSPNALWVSATSLSVMLSWEPRFLMHGPVGDLNAEL